MGIHKETKKHHGNILERNHLVSAPECLGVIQPGCYASIVKETKTKNLDLLVNNNAEV